MFSVQGERELKNDDRAASGANGSHLVQAGHLSELPDERGGGCQPAGMGIA